MNNDLIAALVDNEIRDESQKKEILNLIGLDKSLAIDFKVQMLVKNLVREKIKFQRTPDFVRERILKSITPKEVIKEKKRFFLTDLFEKPAFTFATAVVVVLAIVLILFNRPGTIESKDFAIEQMGSDNMFVQAKNNFKSIVEGKLSPQLNSANPEEIKNFFASKGVKYSTLVPSFTEWNLLGAVVSEDKGEKFAHHVYAGKKGEIIYLFQIDESYIYSHKIVSLSDDLIKYLDDGNCYTTTSNGMVTLLTKADNNICAIVSNASLSVIENNFCNFN